MRHHLSRRTFLQLTGIASLSAFGLSDLSAIVASDVGFARVLRSIISPNGKQHLAQDAVVRLDRRLALEYAWLKAEDIQTMPGFHLRAAPHLDRSELPALLEVRSPVAVIYRRCDVLSGIVSRSGYASGAWATDYLPPGRMGSSAWVGLSDDDGKLLGWSPTDAWQPHQTETHEQVASIRVNVRRQRMHLEFSSGRVDDWLVAVKDSTTRSTTHVVGHRVYQQRGPEALAWSVALANGASIGGATWHNVFGAPRDTADVELHPYLAKWLFRHLSVGTRVEFVTE